MQKSLRINSTLTMMLINIMQAILLLITRIQHHKIKQLVQSLLDMLIQAKVHSPVVCCKCLKLLMKRKCDVMQRKQKQWARNPSHLHMLLIKLRKRKKKELQWIWPINQYQSMEGYFIYLTLLDIKTLPHISQLVLLKLIMQFLLLIQQEMLSKIVLHY